MMKIRANDGTDFFFFGQCAKISLKFTDKEPIFADLSVKPRSKRLNFYGQTAVFGDFVRNRHFSGGPITDKESIFSDVSVNDSDFDKFSAAHHLLPDLTPVLKCPVDKSRTFLSVFVYFSLCAPKRLFQAALDFH